jgi:hypothetical protein
MGMEILVMSGVDRGSSQTTGGCAALAPWIRTDRMDTARMTADALL